MESLKLLWMSTGLANFELGQVIMMLVGCGLLYLAIARNFEPLLLVSYGLWCHFNKHSGCWFF